MITLNTVQDFFDKEVQNIFQNFNTNLGINFVAVFGLQNQNIVALYVCQNILVPDEQNRKTFLIKGKLINDLGTILQQGGAITSAMTGFNNDFKSIIENLPSCTHTFSENMFGFIGFGIQGY